MGCCDSVENEIDDTSDAEIDTELTLIQVAIAAGYNFLEPIQNRIYSMVLQSAIAAE